jgi:protoheme ferro-lyase
MCIVSYVIMQVLTKIQNLLNVPDTETRERDHQEAQFHDDKTLIEVMSTKIQATLDDDDDNSNEYVTMCHGLFCHRHCSQIPRLRT